MFVVYDFDSGKLATTEVFTAYLFAAEFADELNNSIVLELPLIQPPQLGESS